MFGTRRLYAVLLSAVLLLGSVALLLSQTASRELIHDAVDGARLVTLAGNTRPEVTTANDLGVVADSLALNHMMLQLKRSPEREREVTRFVASLQDPASPNFHQWLSASDFGKRFGVAEADVAKIKLWLQSQGFVVNFVYPSGMMIDFSGNAGQVRTAFHTEIHNLDVNGVRHIANAADPRIPAALGPVVEGIVSLHDFKPHNMARTARKNGSIRGQYTSSTGGHAVAPADIATIYDMNPLFAKGVTGKGQTIVVVEDTDLYSTTDWTAFQSTFGLAQYGGTLTTVQPGGAANNCTDPGVLSAPSFNDSEAILDAEWATAAAPGAAIVVASCADTNVIDGVSLAALNVISTSPAPAIVSISYGVCEVYMGAAGNSYFNSLFQQAVAEGTSVFVSAGDEDAASCDAGQAFATHGIGVSGWASTPYNVAAGGTDFSDVYSGTVSQYWSSANTSTYGSALSYIPEIPWNDSCASSLFARYKGYSSVYGATGFCSSSLATTATADLPTGYLMVGGGSGGPSGCARGNPSTWGVVSGTCQGYPKPSWQAGVAGIPADGVRDIPDVSLFASNGPQWGRYAITCFSDPASNSGGAPCTGDPGDWAGFGGTSIVAPELAGIQALINQSLGHPQGNPNVVYYALAAKTTSVFHAITQGDNDVNCVGARNCYGLVGNVDYGRGGRVFATTYGGALSVSGTSFQAAYSATGSYNLATGLGSVDVNALVTNWGK